MTDPERAALKAAYPAHWFCKIVGYGVEAIIAIPKRDPAPAVVSMPGLTLDMLH